MPSIYSRPTHKVIQIVLENHLLDLCEMDCCQRLQLLLLSTPQQNCFVAELQYKAIGQQEQQQQKHLR